MSETWSWQDRPPRPEPTHGECESCGYETLLKAYTRAPHIEHVAPRDEPYPWKWLCDLCARTLAGNAVDYPTQYPDRHIMQTVCHVGNAILAALRPPDSPPPSQPGDEA